MLHIHHINLQPIVGGGEVYTRALSRALADAGTKVTLYAHPEVRLWDGMEQPGLEVVRIENEARLLERLPARDALVLTQSPLSPQCIAHLASRHRLAGFAHMPMFQRSAEGFRDFRLVCTVSRYCIDLLRAAGLQQTYPEPVYGTADLARGDAPLLRRSPYIVDPRKFRDILIGGWSALAGGAGGATEQFRRKPGLTFGLVSLIAPIKQFPELFSILVPALLRQASVNLEVFGAGGYSQVRDLRRALAPLGSRVRYWGYQSNVTAIYPQLDYLMTGMPEKEALGLNAIEAQACGTPVLAPDAPPFTETVVEGASGFRYRDPRQDEGRDFARVLDAIVAGRPRPDPRVAAREHLTQFTHAALVARARALAAALSALE